MRQEALVFLEDEEARRLVAAWGSVHETGDEVHDATVLARAAGLDVRKALRLKLVLMSNEVIYPDGLVDPKAREYIALAAMKKIPRQAKQKEPK